MDHLIILPCICALILGFVLTFPLKRLAQVLGFMDVPDDERRMHTEPIPRIGGLAIYVAFFISICISGKLFSAMPYILSGAIVAVLGSIDDRHPLTASKKLVGQTLAGICLCFFGVTVDNIRLFGLNIETGIIAYPLTVIFVIAVVNVLNLIDGLDGLCCGMSVISVCGLVLLTALAGATDVTAIALVFIFSCMGFFPHNTHPARIFMVDTGSMLCGIVLASLCCQTVFSAEYEFSALTVLALIGIPIFDTAFAIVRRIHNKVGVFKGDKKHVHHRLSARYGHRKAVLLMYAGGVLLSGIALITNFAPMGEMIGGVLLLLCAAYGVIRFGVCKN